MNIVDNFLPIDYYEELKSSFTNSKFPWYYLPYTASPTDKRKRFNGTFSNVLYNKTSNGIINNSDLVNLKPIFEFLSKYVNCKIDVLSARLGLITATPYRVTHSAHIDLPFPHKTAVIYFSRCSNAPTILYDAFYNGSDVQGPEEEICREVEAHASFVYSECIENNMLIFNGLQFHSSTSPVLEENRIALNINFI